MSYTWHDPLGFETFGIYVLETSPDKLGTTEARAYLTEKGNQLTFDSIYSEAFTYDFTVSSTELILTDPANADEIKYNRI